MTDFANMTLLERHAALQEYYKAARAVIDNLHAVIESLTEETSTIVAENDRLRAERDEARQRVIDAAARVERLEGRCDVQYDALQTIIAVCEDKLPGTYNTILRLARAALGTAGGEGE